MNRPKRVWISTEHLPPPLTDAEFGAGWSPVGFIADGQTEVMDQLRRHRSGLRTERGVGFYLEVDDDVEVPLPAEFWLGFDALGEGSTLRVVTGLPATSRQLRDRAPEIHPGRVGPKPRLVPIWMSSGRAGPMFRRVSD